MAKSRRIEKKDLIIEGRGVVCVWRLRHWAAALGIHQASHFADLSRSSSK